MEDKKVKDSPEYKKAMELIDKFMKFENFPYSYSMEKREATQCAIICCNEILGNCENPKNPLLDEDYDFWNKVLTHLKTL